MGRARDHALDLRERAVREGALADGASGYLLKDATPENLSQAINVAMSGGNGISPRVIQNLFDEQQGGGATMARGETSTA